MDKLTFWANCFAAALANGHDYRKAEAVANRAVDLFDKKKEEYSHQYRI